MRHRRTNCRHLTAAALLVGSLVASTAGAQVQATFFANYPATPNPLGPYAGGAVLCSASTFGTATGGFFLNFGDPTTRATLCPATPNLLDPHLNNQLGARFTGALLVGSTGTYNLLLTADDGDALAINGAVVRTDWFPKAGGPGTIQVQLTAGANPFVFDYFQGPCCSAFVQLVPGAGVTVSPPPPPPPPPTTTPEPATLALLATGLVGVAGGTWRRRRAMS